MALTNTPRPAPAQDGSPAGEIALENYAVSANPKKEHGILLTMPGERTYTLAAEDASAYQAWVSALNNACGGGGGGSFNGFSGGGFQASGPPPSNFGSNGGGGSAGAPPPLAPRTWDTGGGNAGVSSGGPPPPPAPPTPPMPNSVSAGGGRSGGGGGRAGLLSSIQNHGGVDNLAKVRKRRSRSWAVVSCLLSLCTRLCSNHLVS